eukprot:15442625-Alexandrium_andersonii.AAC.1
MHHTSSSCNNMTGKGWPPHAVILSVMPVDHGAIHRSLEAVQSDCKHMAAGEAAHPGRQSARRVLP